MARYIAVITKDAESDYCATFPDFPGCFTTGEDLDEVRAMATEALAGHIETMQEDGDEIPPPTPFATVAGGANDPDLVGCFPIEVDVSTAAYQHRRINISLNEGLIARIDAEARRRGMNRSAFLAEGALRLMRDSQ